MPQSSSPTTTNIVRLTGARLAPLGASDAILDDTDLWIADGRIAAILPKDSAPPFDGPYETHRFGNALILPGLINAHSHSSSALLRGSSAGAPLDLYVMDLMWRRSGRSLAQIRSAALLHAMEMLKHGVTGVVDHFRSGAVGSVDAVSAVFAAYRDIGIRAAVAPMFEDKRYIDTLPIDQDRLPAETRAQWAGRKPAAPAEYFAMMEEVARLWDDNPRLRLMLGVEGPQRCTRGLLEMAGDFAARHDVGLHTHLLEAKTQALMAPAEFGGSFVAHLDSFGLIGPKSSLAHFVWCSQRDVEVSAERRVNVVNNPVSNLLLGSGVQPTRRLLDAGVSVAIGSDGCSGNAINMFEQAKTSMLLSRVADIDCDRWISAREALRMVTEGGAAVLGEPGRLGRIEIGAHADLAVLDLNKPIHKPFGNPWTQLVMYEPGNSVDTVFVAGECVVKGGRCVKIDEDAVYALAAEHAAQDLADNAPYVSQSLAERAVFQPLIVEALRRDAPVDRFIHLV
jgi:5-methylthioadenosine/S-adenosylhomocysteine deaminase